MARRIFTRSKRRFQWYSDQDTPDERKLLLKLDLLIVPYVFVAYWLKSLDQNNLNNAYVSGMKEDLGFHGNELVHLQSMYTVGSVLGQLPFIFLLPRLPMHWLLPFLDTAWGVFTLLQYRAQGYSELMAYRFFVGWFEAAFFPVVHYVFGSWYRKDETGRRGSMFYIGSTLGSLTAGLVQSAASSSLEGVHGLAGWRWMYIICALLTIPIGILGFFILPGTPDKPNRLVMKTEDLETARIRLQKAGHITVERFSFRALRKVTSNIQVWILLLIDIFFWNSGLPQGSGAFLLWLRSLNRYSTARVNQLGAIQPALGIFYVLFLGFASDLFLDQAHGIVLAQVWNSIGLIILLIWNVPESAKWFAYMTNFVASAMATLLYGWINDVLKASAAERSAALVFLSAVSQSFTAWTPLLTFRTVESPRFPKGFSFSLACALSVIIMTYVLYSYKRVEE
ncbi:major facilitator superfamily domain-containing protein [Aspergillus coremiiformis]|uniref:Major facilitator superfamily domain-containing protein n=1 Tax=Aspergillus coremiiformis TaxID=138285 RepID=A0A5N6ZCZ2_9EURO|nr:major facilitator superfamily domain-containing protein [Aspergillus coremiiformis]